MADLSTDSALAKYLKAQAAADLAKETDKADAIKDALVSAKELINVHDTSPTTIVTTSARELIASMLENTEMWAVLHTAEPTPTDPLATVVRMTGNYSVPIEWDRTGAVIVNSMPLQFAGIGDATSVNWIAVTADHAGTQILFSGEVEEPETSGQQFGVFVIPPGAIELIIA